MKRYPRERGKNYTLLWGGYSRKYGIKLTSHAERNKWRGQKGKEY